MRPVPVITIDGPSGSGKGTIARHLAAELGWHLLDSGALYRVLAYAAQQRDIAIDTPSAALAKLAETLPVGFATVGTETHAMLDGVDIESSIRAEAMGAAASKVAALPTARAALLARQRAFARPPGLVADGRDMGTVVFPQAIAKIFLTASAHERAKRRYKQLKANNKGVIFPALLRDIGERDRRDAHRAVAPCKAAPDAYTLDSSGLGVEQVLREAKGHIADKLPHGLRHV